MGKADRGLTRSRPASLTFPNSQCKQWILICASLAWLEDGLHWCRASSQAICTEWSLPARLVMIFLSFTCSSMLLALWSLLLLRFAFLFLRRRWNLSSSICFVAKLWEHPRSLSEQLTLVTPFGTLQSSSHAPERPGTYNNHQLSCLYYLDRTRNI
jgi:hypothetical protein